jgi:hypothetical protein
MIDEETAGTITLATWVGENLEVVTLTPET